MANFRAILALFIIFAIVGLLIFSPKGKEILNGKTSKAGSFIKSITGKVSQVKVPSVPGIKPDTKLSIILSNFLPSNLADQEFQIASQDIEGVIKPQIISIIGGNVRLEKEQTNFGLQQFSGNVNFLKNGEIKFVGKATSLKIGEISIEKNGMDITMMGEPITFELKNLKKESITFNSVSGSLKLPEVSGSPLMLSNDKLELVNFEGNIKQKDGFIEIKGSIQKIKLNGVDISKD